MVDPTTYPFSEDVIAYFSMEVGLESAMPTYSGGLGVLAGDTLKAAADLEVPMVGVTLVHRKGYFHQELAADGSQIELESPWQPEARLEPLDARTTITVEGRPVVIAAWRYRVKGVTGAEVPVLFLDTGLPENTPEDQEITDHLYGRDERYRLCQEAVLGIGGVRLLQALGYTVDVYHMNEGHAALLTLALLANETGMRGITGALPEDMEAVRRQCVFTTHTPVPAGHDQFPLDLVREVLGPDIVEALARTECCPLDTLNMTLLALRLSRYINGVSARHGEVSEGLFPSYPIESITNGVHPATWVAAPFADLFDRHIPQWRVDSNYLRNAGLIPLDLVAKAHADAKADMIAEVERRTAVLFDPAVFTLCFARRATPYKRASLLFSDTDRLRKIAQVTGPIQVVYSGKAHPKDYDGKEMIRTVIQTASQLDGGVQVVYLEDYDMALGKTLCAGVDLWLNTPLKPHEASGTSGMKAALNGVPSLSVLDGWWIEGHVEGVTGWSIGELGDPVSNPDEANQEHEEAAALYSKLEQLILPMYYHHPQEYQQVMRSAIALNGAVFNTQRMVQQYVRNAYRERA